MSKLLQPISFEPHRSAQEQIRQRVRQMVTRGELAPQERLPSTHELARHWDVNPWTVQLALQPLVKEGLLTRLPRVGTFVRAQSKKLSRIGIYMLGEIFEHQEGPLPLAVLAQLKHCLTREGIEPDVWIDMRSAAERATVWPALKQAARERRIQALIVPQLTPAVLSWLDELALPYAVVDQGVVPCSVGVDMVSFARCLVERARELGCRSVGLISGMSRHETHCKRKNEVIFADFYRQYGLELELAGIRTKPQWTLIPSCRNATLFAANIEKFGFDLFHRLWSLPDKPDAVLVTDNVMAQGVIKATMNLHVQVPDRLKLICTKLSHVPMFTPIPVSHVVVDESRIAQGLLAQIRRQTEGQPCEPILIACDYLSAEESPDTGQLCDVESAI
ncbi:MAG: GntR family transcriptional regulator [Phycisphaeraceae bacterium]|nr:GntR family transcriptional regulator [Phycisphaeraceae bacterium]